MNRQAGFTLVETLAAGAISVVLGGAILSTLYMTNTQTKEGTFKLELAKYQIAVSQQIRISGRQSGEIKIVGDAAGPLPPVNLPAYPLTSGLSTVYFCDANGVVKSGYQIDPSDYLREWVGGSFIPFRFGNDTVKVYHSTSSFTVLPRRRGVVFKLDYFKNDNGQVYQLPLVSETVICRDQNR